MKLPPKMNPSLIAECMIVVLYLWLGPRYRWVMDRWRQAQNQNKGE